MNKEQFEGQWMQLKGKIKEKWGRLSDDEIAKYLEKNGNIMDEENISKNMDTTGLPSPEDYLIDENALNNYLNDVNAGSNKNTE